MIVWPVSTNKPFPTHTHCIRSGQLKNNRQQAQNFPKISSLTTMKSASSTKTLWSHQTIIIWFPTLIASLIHHLHLSLPSSDGTIFLHEDAEIWAWWSPPSPSVCLSVCLSLSILINARAWWSPPSPSLSLSLSLSPFSSMLQPIHDDAGT